MKWADSRDFWDTDEVDRKSLECDWKRAIDCGVGRYIEKLEDMGDDDYNVNEVQETFDVLWEFHDLIYVMFDYYAAMGTSDDVTHMQMNSFSMFVGDCEFTDKNSEFCKTTHFDQLFIAVDCSGAGGKTDEKYNRKKALNRQEFLHCLVKIACMRYVMPGEIVDVSDAVHHMFCADIEPALDPNIFVEANDFRRTYTYHEAADMALRKHETSLRLIFERTCKLRGQNAAKGITNKLVSMETWKEMCRIFELVDLDLTERDTTLAFVWSRMRAIDEQSDKGRIKLMWLSFEDFLEALCRLCVCKAWPTQEELQAAEIESVGEYLRQLKSNQPEVYADLLSKRNVRWGAEPLQSMPLCIDHLCSLLIVTCQQGNGNGQALTEKEVAAFMPVQSS